MHFFYNIGVNFSPRRYKEGKSTDINSDELRSSAHLKKSIYSVAWVAKYLIVHLFGNCWSAVDSLESTLVPERWPTLETEQNGDASVNMHSPVDWVMRKRTGTRENAQKRDAQNQLWTSCLFICF